MIMSNFTGIERVKLLMIMGNGRGGDRGPGAGQAKADSPVTARPMSSFWICEVPS